jgi:hypothetical protein
MFKVLLATAISIANLFKSRRRLAAENILLRHQLNVAMRRAPISPYCNARFESKFESKGAPSSLLMRFAADRTLST